MFWRSAVITCIAITGSAVFSSSAPAEDGTVKLKEVVVTATKTEKQPQDVTQSVTVITADQIKNSGATNVAEIMRTVTGSVINEYGPLGSLSVISIRGSSYQQVLVLLDGQRLNTASSGGYDLSELPVTLDEIERIEVVRGPSSSLYGADAVGGVVNIITKKPAAPLTTLNGSVGTHGYWDAAVRNAGRENKAYYALSAGKESSDGYRNNSAADRISGGIKLGYDFDAASSIEATSDYGTKDQGVPGSTRYLSPLARQQTRESVTGIRFKERLSNSFDFSVRSYQNRQFIGFQNPDPVYPQDSRHRSRTDGAEMQVNWLLGSILMVTVGAEAREDSLVSTSAGSHAARLQAAYVQNELSLGESLILVVGGRNDQHSVYGDKWSPRASARYLNSGSGTIVRASYGKSFRAPTLNDLYWPDSLYESGNPNLRPETAEEYEGGIEQSLGEGNMIKGTLFRRKVKDLIEWQPDAFFKYSPVNIGRARVSGVEAEAKFTLAKNVAWMVNYTHMFPVNEETGERIFSDVSHIPDMQIGSVLTASLDSRTVLTLDGRWVKNYVEPGQAKWQYYTVDGKITDTVVERKDLKAAVFIGAKNLFNREYETVKGYPMPQQEVYGGVSVQF